MVRMAGCSYVDNGGAPCEVPGSQNCGGAASTFRWGAASWGKNRAPADVVVWMRPVGVVHTMVPSGCWRTVQPVWKVLSR